MSDDIVKRLRVPAEPYLWIWQSELASEAADEIERLRAEADRYARNAYAECGENDRLRAALERIEQHHEARTAVILIARAALEQQ